MTLQFTDPAAGTPLEALAPQDDYEIVRRTLEFTSERYRRQPTLAETARAVRVGEAHLEAVFRRWAGLSPKAFLQAVTIDHARRLLGQGLPLLDAAHEVGLSGPSRLHDLFVRFEAMSPGAHKERGAGLEITYGFADGPFGRTLVLWTDRGLAGIGFSDSEHGGDEGALRDMLGRWPAARSRRDDTEARLWVARVFEPAAWRAEAPLRIVLIGTNFEVRVWERLLAVPLGEATTYGRLAAEIGSPKAARAVGAAVGRNPISFVVPCHRAMGSTGALTGYHWGLTRKRAMLGWEFALARPAAATRP
ncbi:bifunctional helix-turn-helix domain-containing protein/methylated-DNA--[protein]-cysteine S-methyltransferase [Aureimonas jatrophae]|jgi:AraC family transcriptional regulator, regulatory protein of adaptative response / methylated-DNA-[protein]-cysteine methyltransferase|uniref:methylated-DNA--[protein]-cysteine S-methyltransferase n=1 Tax=Aureimonas jatrophae TaxID=1166073 RepID=A0A1H0FMU6_9HYPH|nr:bifunctional helix-turn-helix domain-containing protein/methylated-DNA--[protein]-cysteine S-methyltransferase [Aureimonas jatrophae]SDN95940.1 AraC family transcriptional regulator, regulatory protein of adaptative response / methylated-DNA-[protein]-cysteine methyltransferase [Aureimonas jatrophae]